MPITNNHLSGTAVLNNFNLTNQQDFNLLSRTTPYCYQSKTAVLSRYHFHSLTVPELLLINDVQEDSTTVIDESVDITTVSDDITLDSIIDINDTLPQFFINKDLIKIPNKIERDLQRLTPPELLKAIHQNKQVAIEMCLIFTTQLTSTYFEIKDGSNPEGWKSLHAAYLRELMSINPMAYKNVIKALCHPLGNGPILECDEVYIIGQKNHYYRFGKRYVAKGIKSHIIKTKEAKKVLNKHYFRTLTNSIQNPICQNLISAYADLTLPTIAEIEMEAKRLIAQGFRNKKGKKLRFKNKRPISYYKDVGGTSFVEDSIEIFEYLTDNGLMIPVQGGPNSGGRVVDSFTLMPSWIRNLVRYKGERLIECDYSCLHPNIAVSLYGGNQHYLTHNELALELDIDISDVKVEHLSFFNKQIWQMKESPLFEFYQKREPLMLDAIIKEKQFNQIPKSDGKHKITSRRLFEAEVRIMTEVIRELNSKRIHVLYVYDALLSHPKDANVVTDTMNRIALKNGVKTRAKR